MVLIGLMAVPLAAAAERAPQPPCGNAAPSPAYSRPGAAPSVEVWSKEATPAWTPPPCTGWNTKGPGVLVALAAQFQFAGSRDDLLARFGAVSTLKGLRYWSATEGGWRTLVTNAFALEGPDLARRRVDFTLAELRSGRELYFAQSDNRAGGDVVYKMRIMQTGPSGFVVAIENVSPVRKLMLTLFEPGDLQSLQFVQRASASVWSYYALAWASETTASMLAVPQASYLNRARAFYGHISGVTNAKP